MDYEEIVGAYARVCDTYERHFHPDTYVDGVLNTSKEARAFANEVFDALDIYQSVEADFEAYLMTKR